MKRAILSLASVLLAISMVYSQEVTNERYVLYPTKNIWTFLKLDTSNGKIWQVQYSVEGADYRFETNLNNTSLVLDKSRPAGRFRLYPTDNTYNFILIDTKIGTTYQVQWSQDAKNRMVLPISSDGALIWSCGFAKVKFLSSWNYYDENKNYLTSEFFDECEDFDSGYAKVSKEGKTNYIDTTGNYLFNKWYDDCDKFNSQNVAWVKENGKENLLDITQNPILSKWYDECSYMTEGFIEVGNEGKYNIVNLSGTLLFSEWYDYLGYFDSNGLLSAKKDGKYNFLNIKGEVILPEWYDFCFSFVNGYCKVEKDSKYNYVGINGVIALKEWYDYCGSINDGIVVISKDDKWNFADLNTGLPLSLEWFDDCKSFDEDDTVEVKKGEKWYLMDKKGVLKEL